jgi:hypothetical protein
VERSTFRTFTLPTTNAIRVVQTSSRFQRVVMFSPQEGALVFIAPAAAGLNLPGIPPDSYQLPLVPSPRTFVVQPGEQLTAVTRTVGAPVRLSVAVSDAIARDFARKGVPQPTQFRQLALPVLGAQTIRIIPTGSVPRRVVITRVPANTFVGSAPEDLNIANTPTPGEAIEVTAGMILLVAPTQALYASSLAGGTIEVAISEVVIP